jgi:hypothetical protein
MPNEILMRAPYLAEALAGPDWYYDRKGEVGVLSLHCLACAGVRGGGEGMCVVVVVMVCVCGGGGLQRLPRHLQSTNARCVGMA